MPRSHLPIFFITTIACACASVEGVSPDSRDPDTGMETGTGTGSDTEWETNTDAVVCDEENAEKLCGDPGLCVDGFCCNTVCDRGCEACNLEGLEGTCSPVAADTVCREAAGVCDTAEVCDGESSECPDDELLGTEVECRSASGECDAAEYCDGLSPDGCPEDKFVARGETCGSSDDDECDAPDTCDGAGTCLSNYAPEATACGEPTETECDAPDTCNGAGACEPNYHLADTSCGDPGESICNHPDNCDGAGLCEVNLESSTTLCRAAVNDCDFDEYCDGSGTCPADLTKNPGDACGDSADTECDNPDTCSATLECQPNHEPVTVSCSTATACELASHCDGSGECGGGGFLPQGTLCGSTLDSECDAPDSCDDSGHCLVNLKPIGASCGSAADSACDNPDTCDGSGTCLANTEPEGFGCGDSSNTDCTAADTCDGSGTCLPNHEIPGIPCGDSTEATCNHPDSCDGAGACEQNLEPTTTVCREAVGDCDVPETCNAAGACPANGFATTGTNCGSGPAVCSGQDTCDGTGTCLPNDSPPTTTCGTTVNEYRCSASGCLATPQGRTVSQHCSSGSCVDDTGVLWTDLDSPCLADEICVASVSDASCEVCGTLPADYCSGGNAYHYTGTGSCSSGACTYTPTMETCAVGCTNGTCSTCPGSIWSSNDHCYWYASTGATWDAAEADCVAQGGHLASITSSAENDFVQGVGSGEFWIGLRDYATASTASGNCDDCTNNCVATAQRYTVDTCTWDDQFFTCGGDGIEDVQYKFTPNTTQYYVFSALTAGRFLALSNYIDNHTDVYSCYGGTDYACGNRIIYSLPAGTPILIHVDGTACGPTTIEIRQFVFTDSAAHTWHNWNSLEPNNSGNNEDCVLFYGATGNWNDAACSLSKPYVCERL